MASRAMTECARPRAIGWQLEHRLHALELLAPISEFRGHGLPLEVPPLPNGEVAILDRQGSEWGWLVRYEGGVKRTQFPQHYLHRPTIGHDVMHRQRQQVHAGGKLDQHDSERRPQ